MTKLARKEAMREKLRHIIERPTRKGPVSAGDLLIEEAHRLIHFKQRVKDHRARMGISLMIKSYTLAAMWLNSRDAPETIRKFREIRKP